MLYDNCFKYVMVHVSYITKMMQQGEVNLLI